VPVFDIVADYHRKVEELGARVLVLDGVYAVVRGRVGIVRALEVSVFILYPTRRRRKPTFTANRSVTAACTCPPQPIRCNMPVEAYSESATGLIVTLLPNPSLMTLRVRTLSVAPADTRRT